MAVGQFSMAAKIRVAALTIFTVVGTAFFPRISQYNVSDPEAARALLRKAMLAVFACARGRAGHRHRAVCRCRHPYVKPGELLPHDAILLLRAWKACCCR